MPKGWKSRINWQEIKTTLDSLPKGEKVAYITDVAEAVGTSKDSVYRELRKRFGKSKHVEREAALPKGVLREVAAVKETYATVLLKGTDRELSTQAAIDILREEGVEGADQLSPSTVNRHLRRIGYRDAEPRRRVEAEYACQQFQIDFSRSKHLQIWKPDPDNEGDWLLKISARELHYKDGRVRLRTWVCQLVDEFSRLRVVRYYPATGEGPLMGISFLDWYFNREEDEHLMRHLPERMKSDQGAFMKSQEGRSALEALGIERVLTAPGNKESQGKVERGFRTLWQTFEAKFVTQILRERGPHAVVRLSELNEAVYAHCVSEHAEAHPFQPAQLKGAMYQQSVLKTRPKIVDADVRELALRVWERTPDSSGYFTIEGVAFEAPNFAYGRRIRIYRNLAGDFVGELIDDYRDKPFAIRPYRFSDLDKFEGKHRTYAQEVRSEVEHQLEDKVRQLRPVAETVQPESPFVEVARPVEERRYSAIEVRIRIGRMLADEGLSAGGRKDVLDAAQARGLIRDDMTEAEIVALETTLNTTYRKAM